MANNDFSHFSKKVVQYFWDPLPRNEDASQIWCLGRSYDSRYQDARQSKVLGTSPSGESTSSKADSAVATETAAKPESEWETVERSPSVGAEESTLKGQVELSVSEEEALGWPSEFLDDLEAKLWLTYRSNFTPIPRSPDPAATSNMSFSTRLRNLTAQAGFTSDTGWGCMIRSGQSMLANTLAELRLGRDWRVGKEKQAHKDLLALFADAPEAPFSIHKYVEHGAQACGKHPGEWFGPSATARCIQALVAKNPSLNLRVYVRPDDSDVYAASVIQTATALSANETFEPTLILLGVRLGIDRITPVYHAALRSLLELPQSVGIAGGRPSSSHYFLGHQGDVFFYLDPHTTRSALPLDPSEEDIATCHTRRVRRIGLAEMDPSMLLGFLVKSKDDFEDWRRRLGGCGGKAVVHVHEREPRYATGVEREGAEDEVEAWDETGDET
ncbi:hypothetical protein B0A48_15238 [Cryoendolithus antarcticus]|uniref:Cysteine protease n=1 Tax=Cryoendolithus antarcticus TaxID=1507870 RepID=A0A1V8SIC9_9PEZI|nr:hypothetical protein B0A48_15238 [Cryoendolithus antarcticus]